MRYAVVGVCVFATACAGQGPTSPASPSSSIGGVAATQARGASELPFKEPWKPSKALRARPRSFRMSLLERDKRPIWAASRGSIDAFDGSS